MPNSGKTNSVLNLLVKQTSYKGGKKWKNIFLIHPKYFNYHPDPKQEAKNEGIIVEDPDIPEYKEIDFVCLKFFPSQNYFEDIAKQFNCLIIDDIDILQAISGSNTRKQRVNKLLSYTSTHHNLSTIITSQDPSSQLNQMIMRMCNVFICHPLRDKNQIITLSSKIGCNYQTLKFLYSLCDNIHDFCVLDYTEESPAKYRLNMYVPIDEEIEELRSNNRYKDERNNLRIIKKALNIESDDESKE